MDLSHQSVVSLLRLSAPLGLWKLCLHLCPLVGNADGESVHLWGGKGKNLLGTPRVSEISTKNPRESSSLSLPLQTLSAKGTGQRLLLKDPLLLCKQRLQWDTLVKNIEAKS